MIPYLLSTAVSCLLALLAEQQRRRLLSPAPARAGSRRAMLLCMLLSVLPLLLLSALRWNIGTDYSYTYAPEYDALKWHIQGRAPEDIGLLSSAANAQAHYANAFHATGAFLALEQLLIRLGADVQWLFAVCAVVTLGLVFVAIYRQSEHPALAIFLFVFSSNYFLSLNIMRQFLGIALCLCAFEPAQKRQPVPFLLLVLLAALLHPTALVFLPVYFLYGLRLRPPLAALCVAAALLAAPLAGRLLGALVPALLPKYAWYLGSQHNAGEFELLLLLINLAVLALASCYYKAGQDKPYFRLWYNTNLLGTLFLCFSAVLPLMKRINYYYAACHFLLLPLLLSLEKKPRRRALLLALVCAAFLAETYVAVVLLNKNGVYPYASILEKTWTPYFVWAW